MSDGSNVTSASPEKIRALHEVARDLVGCETEQAVFERAVDAAGDLLNFDQSAVYVRDGDQLVPLVVTGSEVVSEQNLAVFDLDQGAMGHVYTTGESALVEDVQTDDISAPTSPDIRSGLCVALGEFGVFNAISDTPGAFDEGDLALAEILAAHVTTVVQRIRSEAELRRQKRELEAKSERLEEFASILSHDLRNPVSVADGWLEVAAEEIDEEDGMAVTAIENASTAIERIETLIEDLLVVSQEGWSVQNLHRIDGRQVIEDAWATVTTEDATLDCRWDGTVEADRDRLVQAFENLFRNAVEHGSTSAQSVGDATDTSGGSVSIRVGPLEGADGIYVSDDGPGIAPEKHDSIFEMGVSGGGGSGLGLAIVERIVSAHGWSISVGESEAGGARFEIRFDSDTG